MTDASSGLFFTASADGTSIAAERSGNGPPLLLVHGTTASRNRWASVLGRLTSHFTVHALDRRGRGDSGDARDYALEREFEDVAAVIARLGADTSVIGHSYGAICALGGANLAGHVGPLVLYEPPVGLEADPAIVEEIQCAADTEQWEVGLTLFLSRVLHLPDAAVKASREHPDWEARARSLPTIARELRAVRTLGRVPVALAAARRAHVDLLLGGSSIDAFRHATGFLARHLSDVSVHVLDGQQHMAIDVAPALFLDTVLPLLGVWGVTP